MKYLLYIITYAFLHLMYFICEFKIMKYPYKEYINDIETYNDDLNLY